MKNNRRHLLPVLALAVWLLAIALVFALAFFVQPPAPQPRPIPTPIVQHTPTPSKQCTNPLIPYGQLPIGTRYSTVQDMQNQPTLTWMHVIYRKVPGAVGRLWGVFEGKQYLLYEPQSAYCAKAV